jgi:hypothetical protein
MKITLILIAALFATSIYGATSTRSFSSVADMGSDPAKLNYSGGTITVDLSAIQGAEVYRATLDPDKAGDKSQDLIIVDGSGDTLKPLAPRYLVLDATDAVKAAIASGTLTLTVQNAAGLGSGGANISLDVMCNQAAPSTITQVGNASARFKDGDAMITFTEVNPPFTDTNVTCEDYKNYLAATPANKIRYRIYRSTSALTTEAAIRTATLVDEVGPATCWDYEYYGFGPNCYGAWEPGNMAQIVPRFPVDDLTIADPGTGIYVNRFKGTGSETAYYFVSHTVDGAEDFSTLTQGVNATASVDESTGLGMVVKREVVSGVQFQYEQDVTQHYYVRWECPPTCNVPSRPWDYLVAVPKPAYQKASPPVGLALHCWGGNMWSGYGWWYRADEGALLVSSNQWPYDWWTAYHENLGTIKAWTSGTCQPYNQLRMLSFIFDFVMGEFNGDQNRVFVYGSSMGGSGSSALGLRSGHIFSNIISWVGVHIPAETPGYLGSYEGVYGSLSMKCGYSNEACARFGYPVITPADNVSVWDYWDNDQWLRANVMTETPWMSHSNGKNDSGIGWDQAWKNTKAMIASNRPFNFVWGQMGHGQRAALIDGNDRYCGLDYSLNQSLPVFSGNTCDDDLGSTSAGGADAGNINRDVLWNTSDVVDQADRWEMGIQLRSAATQDNCTVSVTPRRLQALDHGPGSTYTWELVEGTTQISNGNATADQYGLITIPNITITKTERRLKINCQNCSPVGVPHEPAKNMAKDFRVDVYPNPFNTSINIQVLLPIADFKLPIKHIGIYDISGRLIYTISRGGVHTNFTNNVRTPPLHRQIQNRQSKIGNSYTWDATNNPNGIYVVKVKTGTGVYTRRITLLK